MTHDHDILNFQGGHSGDMRSISQAELSSHGPASSEPWVGIDGFVYNIKTFGALHPGGEAVLMSEAGKDATEKFKVAHSAAVMKKYHSKLVVGTLQGHHKQEEYIVHADPQWVQVCFVWLLCELFPFFLSFFFFFFFFSFFFSSFFLSSSFLLPGRTSYVDAAVSRCVSKKRQTLCGRCAVVRT